MESTIMSVRFSDISTIMMFDESSDWLKYKPILLKQIELPENQINLDILKLFVYIHEYPNTVYPVMNSIIDALELEPQPTTEMSVRNSSICISMVGLLFAFYSRYEGLELYIWLLATYVSLALSLVLMVHESKNFFVRYNTITYNFFTIHPAAYIITILCSVLSVLTLIPVYWNFRFPVSIAAMLFSVFLVYQARRISRWYSKSTKNYHDVCQGYISAAYALANKMGLTNRQIQPDLKNARLIELIPSEAFNN